MSLLPKWFLDVVVSIEEQDNEQNFSTIATGFFIGLPTGSKDSNGKDYHQVFLVSNRHVFNNKSIFHLRFNKASGAHRYQLPLLDSVGNKLWTGHDNERVDIAVIPIDAAKLQHDQVEFLFLLKEHIATTETITSLNITQHHSR